MELKQLGIAGTLESSDILITIQPQEKGTGRIIELDSPIKAQFGEQIIITIEKVLKRYDVQDVIVSARDRGALDFTIRARTETALLRSKKETNN